MHCGLLCVGVQKQPVDNNHSSYTATTAAMSTSHSSANHARLPVLHAGCHGGDYVALAWLPVGQLQAQRTQLRFKCVAHFVCSEQ